MKFVLTTCILISLLAVSGHAKSGVDLAGQVERIQIRGDGKLWIKVDNPAFNQYCKTVWYGFNMYIPSDDKMFPYYYGLLTTAVSSGKSVFIANISIFDGTTSCDLSKTGYGIVLRHS